MTTSSNLPGEHPQDLLPLYALAALTDREATEVEAHLERCAACRREAALYLDTAAGLGASAHAVTPPAGLGPRLMAAVDLQALDQAPTVSPSGSWSEHSPGSFNLFGWLQPSRGWAPALVIMLAVSVAFNFYLSGTIGRLHENETILAARFLQMAHDDTQVLGFLSDIGVARYLTENTSHQPLELSAAGTSNKSKGVLLFAEDTRKCVLLVSDMQEHEPGTSFNVWLWRPDQRVRVGEISVDSEGWGMMNLYHPQESVLEFEKVYLSRPGSAIEAEQSEDMVLEGSIAAVRAGQ